jgi:hypothetical protein
LMRGPEPAIMSPAAGRGPVGFPPWNPAFSVPVASVAELAYAPGLGPGVRKDVEVRLLSLALGGSKTRSGAFGNAGRLVIGSVGGPTEGVSRETMQ